MMIILSLFPILHIGSIFLCNEVRYVAFNTNLTLYKGKVEFISNFCLTQLYFSANVTIFLLSQCDLDLIILVCFHLKPNTNIFPVMNLIPRKNISFTLSCATPIIMFNLAYSPVTHFLCLLVFQAKCYSFVKYPPSWLSVLLILLSHDIHLNPGPGYQNHFFNFMTWNLNSLTKNDFERVRLIEAHNSLFDYDLISICETNLNDSLVTKVPKIDGYEFKSANHPGNTTHGGVGIFYKDSLPVTPRHDLSFEECIVLELKFGRKKNFFTVLYRSPSFKHSTPEFEAFLQNFNSLYNKIKAENPFAMYFTGDFNGHSQFWWPEGGSNLEGSKIEELFTSLNLTQIIADPTNFETGKNPSCIDLIVTDQPNLILDCGTRGSLDPRCHHQIIYGKVNFRIPPPPPCERTIWHYHRANTAYITRSLEMFPWLDHLSLNHDVNWQVKTFTDIFLNIMRNFIPNEIKRIVPRNPPWINKQLKTLLNKKNRLFKNYKRHGYKAEDKARLDLFREKCQVAVEQAKTDYLNKLGNKLNDSRTSQKTYWKIINRVINKCRAPKIPPILINNVFIMNCKEKAKLFNDFFSNQCKPIINNSILPHFNFLTDKRIDHIVIQNKEILSLIRNLN